MLFYYLANYKTQIKLHKKCCQYDVPIMTVVYLPINFKLPIGS